MNSLPTGLSKPKVLEAYVHSLDKDSEVYKQLPRNDRGTILLGNIKISEIPNEFIYAYRDANKKGKKHNARIPKVPVVDAIKDKLISQGYEFDDHEYLVDDDSLTSITVDIPEELKALELNNPNFKMIQFMFAFNMIKDRCTTSEILNELKREFKLSNVAAQNLYNKARELAILEYQSNLPEIKASLGISYEELYKKSLEKDDLKLCKDLLDSMAKLSGANEPEKVMQLSEIIVRFDGQ